MKLKLKKISVKSFIITFSTINLVAGFIIGLIVTVMSLVAPDEQVPAVFGVWAILTFPILNAILGVVSGALITGAYNIVAQRMGGIELEFEAVQ